MVGKHQLPLFDPFLNVLAVASMLQYVLAEVVGPPSAAYQCRGMTTLPVLIFC
jgi:hypothetical protein